MKFVLSETKILIIKEEADFTAYPDRNNLKKKKKS